MQIEIYIDGDLTHVLNVRLKSDTKRFLFWDERAKARIQEVEDHLANIEETLTPYLKPGIVKYGLIFQSKPSQ